jgi:hypothetical protein
VDAYLATDKGEKNHKTPLDDSDRKLVKADFTYPIFTPPPAILAKNSPTNEPISWFYIGGHVRMRNVEP